MASTLPLVGRDTVLDRIAGPGGIEISVRAAQNDIPVNDGIVLTDLTECDYSGYTPQASNLWSGPFSEVNADRYLQAPPFTFAFTSGLVHNVAYLYYLTINISGTDRLLWARRLPFPVAMAGPGNSFFVSPRLSVRALIF